MALKEEALTYHSRSPHGKLEITPTKPCATQYDLSLAYTPGVAEPCLAIRSNPEDSFKYTARGNLVAVITNGTAVLGLGNIGALAGKPVMEGKALLFKRFADIDSIDLEVNTEDPELLVQTVKLLEPSFGGINLEDIKAPECFYVEERLKQEMNIPVFHDDQHGTAIISGAALINGLEIVDKPIGSIRMVICGAGASAIASAKIYLQLGMSPGNIVFCDSTGVIYKGRDANMNRFKEEIAVDTTARTLSDALDGADVFVGLSGPNLVTQEMLKKMATMPMIFALANPDPEITYEQARQVRPDAVIATGRSDFPNQVNNVLGFPFIFRGALDVRATQINEVMKIAAVNALANLAKEDVPEAVVKAYGIESLTFGPDYLIPKPFDPRVLLWEAPAVAKAAMETGVAGRTIDLEAYRDELEARLGKSREMMRVVFHKARELPKRIALAEGEHEKTIRAAHQLIDERIAVPLLIGNADQIKKTAAMVHCSLEGVEIVDPATCAKREQYAERVFEIRQRKGITRREALKLIADPNYFASIMVEEGDADGMVTGVSYHYSEGLRAPLQIVGLAPESKTAVGIYLVTTRNRALFFADATINIDPDAETLADIAIQTARFARDFNVDPYVAMLSFSTFGSARHPKTETVRKAVEIVRQREPTLPIDGEMQAQYALSPEMLNEGYPFNRLQRDANVLIFPNLDAGNIGQKLVQRLAHAEVVGPILVGMRKPVYILQRGDEVKDIVNLSAIAVVEANRLSGGAPSQASLAVVR